MFDEAALNLEQFFHEHPLMALRPQADKMLVCGRFSFDADHPKFGNIADDYDLTIELRGNLPEQLPTVIEEGKKIPRSGEYHVNPDTTLCLGSPMGLLVELAGNSSLTGFVERCLVPYLFGVSYKLRNGGPLPFGELAHGHAGVISDYLARFELKSERGMISALEMLGRKKRIANKKKCPCGCGKRLGRCQFNFTLRNFRSIARRSWFRKQAQELAPFAGRN